MKDSEPLLRIVLRVLGTSSGFAVLAVFLPESTMAGIHRWLGLGELPGGPIVGYLARSTSAFYALLGGLLWVLSFDVRRYRPALIYLGSSFLVFGIALLFIDWHEGLPAWWTIWEFLVDCVFGFAILWLARHLKPVVSRDPCVSD